MINNLEDYYTKSVSENKYLEKLMSDGIWFFPEDLKRRKDFMFGYARALFVTELINDKEFSEICKFISGEE